MVSPTHPLAKMKNDAKICNTIKMHDDLCVVYNKDNVPVNAFPKSAVIGIEHVTERLTRSTYVCLIVAGEQSFNFWNYTIASLAAKIFEIDIAGTGEYDEPLAYHFEKILTYLRDTPSDGCGYLEISADMFGFKDFYQFAHELQKFMHKRWIIPKVPNDVETCSFKSVINDYNTKVSVALSVEGKLAINDYLARRNED